METNQILQADLLDILFEGKNKEYGAYALRKTYNGRLFKALMITGAVIALLIGGWFVSRLQGAPKKWAFVDPGEVILVEAKPDPPAQAPPRPKPVMPQAPSIKDAITVIVPDDQFNPKDTPPDDRDLDNARISTITTDGPGDVDVVAPPNNQAVGDGVVAKPVENLDDKIFRKVEIDPEYPGGPAAWTRFLNKNLRYPDEALNIRAEGTIVVEFVVDQDGNLSDLQVLSGPKDGGLGEEVFRVLRKSGKWSPGIQNGRPVKSYWRQPITFKAPEE